MTPSGPLTAAGAPAADAGRPRTRRRFARCAAVLAVVAAVVFAAASPASAHATLESAEPGDGQVVASSPAAVTLRFSERVSLQPDGIRILSSDGRRVDKGTATADGSVATSPVDGTLDDGSYVVAWRVVSDDGHPVHGAFTFSVGKKSDVRAGLADSAFAGSADRRDEIIGGVLRGLVYLAVLGAAGLVLVGYGLRRDDDGPPVTPLVGAVAAVGALAAVAQLPLQAALATGRGWGSITDQGTLRLAAGDGVGWSVGGVVLGLVAIGLTAGLRPTRAVRLTATVGAVIAPLALVVTGHTRTMDPKAVGWVADAAHLVAGTLWFGGLIALGLIVRRRRAADDVTGAGAAVARFSGWAATSVAVLTVAGIVMGWIETGGLQALFTTTYGRLLLAKVAVVALVLVGAAWNRFRFVPHLVGPAADPAAMVGHVATGAPDGAAAGTAETGGPADWSRFTRTLRLEVVGLVVVLALTAVLVNVTPGKAANAPGKVDVSARLGSGSVEVIVDPARVGANELHVYLLDASQGIDDRYEAITVQASLPAQKIGPLDLPLVKVGPGHFQVVNTRLPLAGTWTVAIAAKLDRFTEVDATVSVRIR